MFELESKYENSYSYTLKHALNAAKGVRKKYLFWASAVNFRKKIPLFISLFALFLKKNLCLSLIQSMKIRTATL